MNLPEGIYGILPSGLEDMPMLSLARSALKGGLKTLQLRDKKATPEQLLARARALRDLTRLYGATLIINDDVKVALESDADGVHVGRDDAASLGHLRGMLGGSRLLGVTCRQDTVFARQALNLGASYVSIGAVFPTKSKPDAVCVGIQAIRQARTSLPNACIVAVGGINEERLSAVRQAGANAAAMISGLFEAGDVEERTRQLIEAWQAG